MPDWYLCLLILSVEWIGLRSTEEITKVHFWVSVRVIAETELPWYWTVPVISCGSDWERRNWVHTHSLSASWKYGVNCSPYHDRMRLLKPWDRELFLLLTYLCQAFCHTDKKMNMIFILLLNSLKSLLILHFLREICWVSSSAYIVREAMAAHYYEISFLVCSYSKWCWKREHVLFLWRKEWVLLPVTKFQMC